MFDSLAEKLQATLADVRGRGTLTEDDVSAAMREIRLALLEADVNFKVVRSFTSAVRDGKPAPIPAEEVIWTNVIMDGIYRSAAAGCEVEVGLPG